MDIEQLKLVMDMVGGVSGDAKEVAMWWVEGNVGVQLMSFVVGIIAIALMYKLAMQAFGLVKAIEGLKTLRDLLGVGSYGALTDSEINGVVSKVHKLVNGDKA